MIHICPFTVPEGENDAQTLRAGDIAPVEGWCVWRDVPQGYAPSVFYYRSQRAAEQAKRALQANRTPSRGGPFWLRSYPIGG